MNREYVDLGLSVKWATMNIGAERITDHGGYFAWEELCNRCNCIWEWTSIDDTLGCRVTSKKEGYTDQSIFLASIRFWI